MREKRRKSGEVKYKNTKKTKAVAWIMSKYCRTGSVKLKV
jgi:hypothetical protein